MLIDKPVLPICTIDPGYTDCLEDDHDHQGQRGGIIVEHGHEVVAAPLSKEQSDQEA